MKIDGEAAKGFREERHLSPVEQRVMGRALRRSIRILPQKETDMTMMIEGCRAALMAEGYNSDRAEKIARVVIGAMSELTEEMVRAGHGAWDRNEAPGPFTFERIWRAEITAALNGEQT